MQFVLGISIGVLISLLAWRVGALSSSGAVAAAISGGLIFGIGHWPWAALLLTFFVSSSALSKLFRSRKVGSSEKFAKGNQRDWAQVLANDGVGVMLVLVLIFRPDRSWIWIAYAGAMAAVNADTWATELGVLSPKPPRLITNGQVVEAGTSGGISLMGTLASLAGAALIGAVAAASFPRERILFPIAAATLGGVCGSLFDSLLGATGQAIYNCPVCQKETESHPLHSCGAETVQIRGWSWLDNDLVNFLASVVGAVIAVGVWGWLR
ncbi:MAG: DUF92 domain-containing protein [Chloroflexota bacterium]|nr:DUF92 domain-containing protein [Chloroflexota bacterium]